MSTDVTMLPTVAAITTSGASASAAAPRNCQGAGDVKAKAA